LLLNLVHGPSRLKVDTTATTTTSSSQALSPMTAYYWQGGNETASAERFLQDNLSSFRSPLASWTLEVPKNSPTNLVVLTSFDENILGKQDPLRQDRQGSMMLPCCSPGKFSSLATIGVADGSDPLANVQAIFSGLGSIRLFDNLQIYQRGVGKALCWQAPCREK
jgi:hypothetical protein